MPTFPGLCAGKTIAMVFRFLLSRITGAGGSGLLYRPLSSWGYEPRSPITPEAISPQACYTASPHPAVVG
jgi:hypothetical protein